MTKQEPNSSWRMVISTPPQSQVIEPPVVASSPDAVLSHKIRKTNIHSNLHNSFQFAQFVKRSKFVIVVMVSLAASAHSRANARDADCTIIEFVWDNCPCVMDSCSSPFQMDDRTLFRTDSRTFVETAVPKNPARIEQPIAGAWTLVSIYEEDAGGEEINRFEDGAKGHLITDHNGNFSLQIMNLSARRPRTTAAQCVEPSALIDAMAYFGTYFLDPAGERLTLRVERCLFKECDLIDQNITTRINGNVMEWVSIDAFSTTGAYYRQFVWQRK